MIRPIRILIISFLVMLVGCSEKNAPQQAGNDIFYITVSTPSTETKTVIGDKTGETYSVYWENGDRISLNGLVSGGLSGVVNKSSEARFNIMGDPYPPYTILYPGKEGQNGSVTFLQHQTYKDGSVASGSLPMAGVSESLKAVSMEPIGAVLCLPLTGKTTIRGILLRAVAGEPLSGEYSLEEKAIKAPQTGGFIWLDVPSAVSLSNNPKLFYISIPAGKYSEGIKLTVFDENGYNTILSFGSEGFTAERGIVYELPQTEFVARPTAAYFVTRESELNLADDYIIILNDIDMSGISWRSTDFSGVIEGLGHELIGMESPLVNNLKGRIHNLKIDADLIVSDRSEAGIFACGNAGGLIEDCVAKGRMIVRNPNISSISYYGGVCGRNRGTVFNCVNSADITGSSEITESSASLHFGGVTGAGAGQIVKNCINEGDISYEGIPDAYVGGITGRGTSGAVITGNSNYGRVKSNKSKNVGAIIGSYSSSTVQDNSDYSGQ